jgi:hypothetical protein
VATPVDKARIEKGLSIVGLLKNTPRYIKEQARDQVVVKKYGKAKTKGGHTALQAICQTVFPQRHKPHKCHVIGLDPEKNKVAGQKRVIVSCDCEFFLFYCEYALSTWGAARIKHSNGEPAVVRNPGNVPLVCRHLVPVLKLIKDRGD